MNDLLPQESGKWQEMEGRLRTILNSYAYSEIRTPILEETDLFARSVGTTSDIVEKEMFSFTDKGGTNLSLRPEGTASVVRAYIEHHLSHGEPLLKVWYLGPMFRHERPQKGRLRQFHQVGAEAMGSEHPLIDVEMMALVLAILRAFDVPDVRLEINSIGDETCRPAYMEKLTAFLKKHESELCENCRRRITTNPLRVLDCKSESCKKVTSTAPLLFDHLCSPCRAHHDAVVAGLKALDLPFEVNPRIVRGLDYYRRTAFEVTAGGLGAQNAVVGGGRYDKLSEELGGEATPSIGFALGLERLLLSARKVETKTVPRTEFIPLDPSAEIEALKLATRLREAVTREGKGAVVDVQPNASSLKSALRRADKNETMYAILIGTEELQKKKAMVKNLPARAQEEVPFSMLIDNLLTRFP